MSARAHLKGGTACAILSARRFSSKPLEGFRRLNTFNGRLDKFAPNASLNQKLFFALSKDTASPPRLPGSQLHPLPRLGDAAMTTGLSLFDPVPLHSYDLVVVDLPLPNETRSPLGDIFAIVRIFRLVRWNEPSCDFRSFSQKRPRPRSSSIE